jgi:hypothetical protein
MSFFVNTNVQRRDGRDADIIELEKGLHSSDPKIRANAHESARKIANESGYIKDMRASLIREYRHGRMDNVQDIREDMFKQEHR